MAKKILDLIPESLHEQLREEVIDLLKAGGYTVKKGDGTNTDAKKVEADIEAWAKSNTEQNK